MRPCHVLVIDDNEVHRQVVADVLADEGYQVSIAATGEDGLAAVLFKPFGVSELIRAVEGAVAQAPS